MSGTIINCMKKKNKEPTFLTYVQAINYVTNEYKIPI